MACDCKDPVPEGSYLDRITNGVARDLINYCRDNQCGQSEAIARLTKTTSTAIAARVPNTAAAQLRTLAAARGMAVGAYVRRVLLSAVARPTAFNPAKAFETIRAALGLPSDADVAEVAEAAEALLAAMSALEQPDEDEPATPGVEPTGEAPDAEPPGKQFATSRGKVTLSASELKACASVKADPEDYAENKAIREAARGASPRPEVRRTSVELTPAGQRLADEMTPEHRANFLAAVEIKNESRARLKGQRERERSRGIDGREKSRGAGGSK